MTIFNFLKKHENEAKKLKIHEKLQYLSKENSISIPYFNAFISLSLKMSYFMPNIIAKKKMYQFWVKKKTFRNVSGGSKCSKMLKNAIFCTFTTKKTSPKFFLTQN